MIIDHYYIDYIDHFYGFVFVLRHLKFTFNLLTIYYFIFLKKIVVIAIFLL